MRRFLFLRLKTDELPMLTGKSFTIITPTLSVDLSAQKITTMIPTGATVKVIRGPKSDLPNELVDVLWDGRIVVMFAHDIQNRAEEVKPDA
jgi:hypothetical protein